MNLSAKKIIHDTVERPVLFDSKGFYFVVEGEKTELVKTPVLDENGNHISSKNDENKDVFAFTFVEKKYNVKSVIPFFIEDEVLIQEFKLKSTKIKDLEDFLKPVELK